MDTRIFGRRSAGLVMIIASGRGFVCGWEALGVFILCTPSFCPFAWVLFVGESVGQADVMRSLFITVILFFWPNIRFFRRTESSTSYKKQCYTFAVLLFSYKWIGNILTTFP